MRLEQLYIAEANFGKKAALAAVLAGAGYAGAKIIPNSAMYQKFFGKPAIAKPVNQIIPDPHTVTLPPGWSSGPPPETSPAQDAPAAKDVPTAKAPVAPPPVSKTPPASKTGQSPPKLESLIPTIAQYILPKEGKVRTMYKDTRGIPTVGVGYNLLRDQAREELTSVGANYDRVLSGRESLSDDQIKALFEKDMKLAVSDVRILVPNIDKQPFPVQRALVDMSFNMGRTRLSGFVKMLAAVRTGDYETAADELIDSKYYRTESSSERAAYHAAEIRKCKGQFK